MSRLGPVIIIVFGCDEGRLPEPDEALELVPDDEPLAEPLSRLFMLKGIGELD